MNEADVEAAMALRKTGGTYSSKRKEADRWNGERVLSTEKTRGTIEVHIANNDARSATTVSCPTILGRAIKTW